jgi:hypothetical protein
LGFRYAECINRTIQNIFAFFGLSERVNTLGGYLMERTLLMKIAAYSTAGIFIFMILSLGIAYALSAGQMFIYGQAYFLPQPDPETDLLPIYPMDPEGDGNYIIVSGVGAGTTIFVIEQEYIDGDLHLAICTNNTNMGQTDFAMSLQFTNPTVYPWTNGSVSFVSPAPPSEGGIPITGNFTFNPPTLTPASLTTGQVATVRLSGRGQIGRPEVGGSAIVTIQYDVHYGGPLGTLVKSTRVFFSYFPRQSAECPL